MGMDVAEMGNSFAVVATITSVVRCTNSPYDDTQRLYVLILESCVTTTLLRLVLLRGAIVNRTKYC